MISHILNTLLSYGPYVWSAYAITFFMLISWAIYIISSVRRSCESEKKSTPK